jgi:anti-sigma regulatory factor (Ser/Thr protein kinase)
MEERRGTEPEEAVSILVRTVSLLADTHAAMVARRAVDEFLDELVSTETREDARLLASELVTNSVRHAGLAKGDSIGLSMGLTGDRIRIEVIDRGEGFEVPAPPAPAVDLTAGWGLLLVQRISDRWNVERRPTSVWFEIDP